MSVAVMVLGESGTGKTTALRNMDPKETLLIQTTRKPLPFRSTNWKYFGKDSPTGNVFVADTADRIITLMRKTSRKIIVLDDFQYLLSFAFFRMREEKGFEKFTTIGGAGFDVLTAATSLPDDVRVYLLAHTQSDDGGRVKMKTLGKMLDEKLTPEGLFAIVLRTAVINGQYFFSTRNNGHDTVKSPLSMFPDEHIPNDLAAVDEAICAYYELNTDAPSCA